MPNSAELLHSPNGLPAAQVKHQDFLAMISYDLGCVVDIKIAFTLGFLKSGARQFNLRQSLRWRL